MGSDANVRERPVDPMRHGVAVDINRTVTHVEGCFNKQALNDKV